MYSVTELFLSFVLLFFNLIYFDHLICFMYCVLLAIRLPFVNKLELRVELNYRLNKPREASSLASSSSVTPAPLAAVDAVFHASSAETPASISTWWTHGMPWLPGQHFQRGLSSGRRPVCVSTVNLSANRPGASSSIEVGDVELHNTTVIESQPPQQD